MHGMWCHSLWDTLSRHEFCAFRYLALLTTPAQGLVLLVCCAAASFVVQCYRHLTLEYRTCKLFTAIW